MSWNNCSLLNKNEFADLTNEIAFQKYRIQELQVHECKKKNSSLALQLCSFPFRKKPPIFMMLSIEANASQPSFNIDIAGFY